MEANGKVYRNLEGQVAYLTQYLETNALANEMGIKVLGRVDSVDDIPAGDYEYGDAYMIGEEGATPYRMVIWSRDAGDGNPGWFDIGYFPTAPDEFSIVEVNSQPVHVFNADTKLDKDTSETIRDKVYAKATDGSQIMISVSGAAESGSIPLFLSNGKLNVGTPTDAGQAANKGYVDNYSVAKQSGATSFRQVYAKAADGSQYMLVVNNKDADAGVDRIACYGTDGRLRVGAPVNDKDATTKKYVDDSIGQLIYKHDITLSFTVSSNLFQITINLLNGTSTAYTSVDGRQLLYYLKSGSYSIATESYAASKFWSVAVCPSDKYIHTDTGIGFILTAGSDGSTIYVDGIDPLYNTDITGVTITDTVTTW